MQNPTMKTKKEYLLAAVILNILTLGFYSLFWIQKNLFDFNKKELHNKRNIILYACYFLLICQILSLLPNSIFLLYFALKTSLLFVLRKQIHNKLSITPHSKSWLNPFYTFIFGFLYLIYKLGDINYTNNTHKT